MTIVTAGPAKWTWSEDVLAFARQKGVEPYLDPLMEATRELFPDAREMRIFVESDPEIPDERHIGWEVVVEFLKDEYTGQSRSWGDVLRRIVPAPLTCVIRQYLLRVNDGSA